VAGGIRCDEANKGGISSHPGGRPSHEGGNGVSRKKLDDGNSKGWGKIGQATSPTKMPNKRGQKRGGGVKGGELEESSQKSVEREEGEDQTSSPWYQTWGGGVRGGGVRRI